MDKQDTVQLVGSDLERNRLDGRCASLFAALVHKSLGIVDEPNPAAESLAAAFLDKAAVDSQGVATFAVRDREWTADIAEGIVAGVDTAPGAAVDTGPASSLLPRNVPEHLWWP